jgi:hypothetical protein
MAFSKAILKRRQARNNENCLIKFITVVVVAVAVAAAAMVAAAVGAVVAVLSHPISKGLLFDLTAIICHFPPLIWHVWTAEWDTLIQ